MATSPRRSRQGLSEPLATSHRQRKHGRSSRQRAASIRRLLSFSCFSRSAVAQLARYVSASCAGSPGFPLPHRALWLLNGFYSTRHLTTGLMLVVPKLPWTVCVTLNPLLTLYVLLLLLCLLLPLLLVLSVTISCIHPTPSHAYPHPPHSLLFPLRTLSIPIHIELARGFRRSSAP